MSTVVMSWLLTTYYNVIMSWAIFYLISSMTSSLPWEQCEHTWNSDQCKPIINNETSIISNETMINSSSVLSNTHSSTQEFYDRRVLKMTQGEALACRS